MHSAHMSNADYIAKKYLRKDQGKKKKKKEKDFVEIQDEDVAGWDDDNSFSLVNRELTSLHDAPTIVASESLKDRDIDDIYQDIEKTTNKPAQLWKAVGNDEVVESEQQDSHDAESIPQFGLLTGKQVTFKAEERRKREEQSSNLDEEELRKSRETVYRDATGRRIDLVLARKEAKRKLKEKEEEARRQKEQQQGVVQVRQQKEYLKELERQKTVPLARYEDDPEYNKELKERSRWNDPAASFLTNKPISSKATYQGYAPPNRFNIRPGHRWDGIIRGNGFENKWFQRQNERKAQEHEAHMWAIEE